MGKQFGKDRNWLAGIAAAAFFAMAVYVVHEMQSAEGVGLYFAIRFGGERLMYDAAVDAVAASGLFLLLFLPCVCLHYGSAFSLLRFQAAFFAFMPTLRTAYLLNPLQGEKVFLVHTPLFVLRTVLPFLCLLAAGVRISVCGAEGEPTQKKAWKRWYSVCCAGAAVLFGITLFVTSLQPLLNFLLVYFILLVCFDLWERLLIKYPALNLWGWILFGGLMLRGFYVLSELLRRY